MKKVILTVLVLILGVGCYLYFRTDKRPGKVDSKLNRDLVKELGGIYHTDQLYRSKLDSIMRKSGQDSEPFHNLVNKMRETDSINLLQVERIIDQKGWLGSEVIGPEGNQTLFLVIQHSDQKTQEKYLPVMRVAVKKGNAAPDQLALLEDRVLLGQGKKQIYGSQIGTNDKTIPATFYVLPLEDPDNVDRRRAKVGLGPISEYLSYWNMTWDSEKYKKELAAQESAAGKMESSTQ